MERRKIIVYIIFVIVAAYGFHFHFLSGKSAVKQNSPASAPVISKAKIASIPEAELPDQEISLSNEIQPARQTLRSRNPFKNKKSGQRITPVFREPVRHSKPDVSAISADGSETFVIANNKIIKIGERIGVWTLVRAEPERALFDGPDGTVWVNLGG
jgi:hypothetical protein